MAAVARILVVDDDPDFRASLRALLEAHDYEVVEAASGSEGLQALVKQRPDAILLDVMMECCGEGYGVNAAVKFQDEYAGFRDVPIFMISSIEETPDERFFMAPEVAMIRPDWYLTKPVNISRLLSLLEREVRGTRAVPA